MKIVSLSQRALNSLHVIIQSADSTE